MGIRSSFPQPHRGARDLIRRGTAIGLSLAIGGCSSIGNLGGKVSKTVFGGSTPKEGQHLTGFIGAVAADEPRAALAAREILATGGNAADAAVTLGFMLSVTLPSRASLGAGGACIAYSPATSSPNGGSPEAILFTPRAPAAGAGDRPAAVPMLARGLYLLSARYGTKPFEQLVAPAEQIARFGHPIARALAADLSQVSRPLLGDPAAAAVFGPNGTALGEGDRLIQSDLGGTLAQIRTVGVGDMYQGLLAHKLAEATAEAGGPVGIEDLRAALPALANPIVVPAGDDRAAFLPPPADGGLGAAAAFKALHGGGGANAGAIADGAIAAYRAQGGDPTAILAAPSAGSPLPSLPASTSFVVVDRKGDAVACAVSMNNLFGTGRIAPGTGIVLGASPRAKPMALLTAAIAWNTNLHAFRAAIGASGQDGAALAGAVALDQAIAGRLPPETPVPEPGRANAIGCPRYLPGTGAACTFATDPRASGLALGGA